MSLKLEHETKIRLDNFPIQWIEKFELYYPDLPHFPIVYVHFRKNGRRVFGCPVSVRFDISDSPECGAEVTFVSNEDLENQPDLKSAVRDELRERFGLTNRVTLDDVISSCNGDQRYETFFRELWERVKTVSGDSIPFGRFYEELFSIVRFVSAWNPKTGRQSEMRMLYNFMSIFGERTEAEGKWSYLEFYLLPTYAEIFSTDLAGFPKFKGLMKALRKVGPVCFNWIDTIAGHDFLEMEKAWPAKKEDFINEVTNNLIARNVIDTDDKMILERLVDAFNRHSGRASYFVWSILNSLNNDYRNWNRNLFTGFYLNQEEREGKGVSEKVVACYLQQGFGNPDAVPIDTWVESFHEFPLALGREDFLNKFSNLAKLERVIWLVSQMKKTNLLPFFDILWCIRFGTNGNSNLRESNPIACFECSMKNVCPGYSDLKNLKVFITESNNVRTKVVGKKKKEVVIASFNEAHIPPADCTFVCLTENRIPKKSFELYGIRKPAWTLTDEFSGYIIDRNFVPESMMESAVTVERMIEALGSFTVQSSVVEPEP